MISCHHHHHHHHEEGRPFISLLLLLLSQSLQLLRAPRAQEEQNFSSSELTMLMMRMMKRMGHASCWTRQNTKRKIYSKPPRHPVGAMVGTVQTWFCDPFTSHGSDDGLPVSAKRLRAVRVRRRLVDSCSLDPSSPARVQGPDPAEPNESIFITTIVLFLLFSALTLFFFKSLTCLYFEMTRLTK